MRFDAKVAVVAGGGDEVGRAIAIGLAAEGAKVVIWDADADAASQVQKQIAKTKGQAQCMRVNALEYGEVKAAVDQVLQQFGEIDIMIVVSPVTRPGPLVDVAPESWQQQIDAQSDTAFNCNQAVIAAMAGRSYGKILNLVSLAVGTPKLLAAGVGSAIVASLTQTMAAELAQQKINVNCLAGLVPTPSLRKAFESVSGGKELLERQIAMSARGANTPEDVAKVALFLVSDDAERISGQTFLIQ
jgi:NAD(P)-dependent dehydrogenase (short-subunit alcohol dehydrogenase family)